MKVKEESEKVGLKLSIQKTKIMASGPITSWEMDEETVKLCQTLFFCARPLPAHLPDTRQLRPATPARSSA